MQLLILLSLSSNCTFLHIDCMFSLSLHGAVIYTLLIFTTSIVYMFYQLMAFEMLLPPEDVFSTKILNYFILFLIEI